MTDQSNSIKSQPSTRTHQFGNAWNQQHRRPAYAQICQRAKIVPAQPDTLTDGHKIKQVGRRRESTCSAARAAACDRVDTENSHAAEWCAKGATSWIAATAVSLWCSAALSTAESWGTCHRPACSSCWFAPSTPALGRQHRQSWHTWMDCERHCEELCGSLGFAQGSIHGATGKNIDEERRPSRPSAVPDPIIRQHDQRASQNLSFTRFFGTVVG